MRGQAREIVRPDPWHVRRSSPFAMSIMPTAPELAPSPPSHPAARAPVAAPPERHRASVADRVARAFPPLACVRGFRYFARRRVTLHGVTDSAVDADVKGTRVQHVRLRLQEGNLCSACSCSAKVFGPATCRHVWATLLEIDRQGALLTLRGTERALALGALDAARTKRPAKNRGRGAK